MTLALTVVKTAKKTKSTTPDGKLDIYETVAAEPTQEIKDLGMMGKDHAITLYLREIGLTPLLTPQQEIELAARIKRGDRKAREQMIKANLRLVVKIAKDYSYPGSLPLLDLINEGNIGLMKAVERFDPIKGAKLSTYGAWWIKQSIRRAIANQAKTIRLPIHVVDKVNAIRKVAERLFTVFGRDATNEEIAAEMGTEASAVSLILEATMFPLSLDTPIDENTENGMVADLVPDHNAEDPYTGLEGKDTQKLVEEVFKNLDERERVVLNKRFGLDGCKPQSLEEVGVRFNITRERIRQIQNSALRKLRKKIESRNRPALKAA